VIREPIRLLCTDCKKEYEVDTIEYKCPDCEGLLWFKSEIANYKNLFSKIETVKNFWDFSFTQPNIKEEFIVSLGEGGTPCKDSEKIGQSLELNNLRFKNETLNPTNSFKDRVGALLISHARSWDYQKVVCASNGNQGASVAAYASIEGMKCFNIIPSEIDIGKRAQMIAYNSELEVIGNTIDDAIQNALASKFNDYYQCTPEYNPLTIEAQKTIAFEIFKQKGIPDWVIIPMGSGELLVSLSKGFNELVNADIVDKIPKLVGVQSEISAPIVNKYFEKNTDHLEEEKKVKSLALGILVKKPLYNDLAIKFTKESKGTLLAVSEDSIVNSIDELIRSEGIFAEPASALTLAAVFDLNQDNLFDHNDNIVCLITGSGLKAPYVLEAISSQTTTSGKGSIIITKLKILSQISLTSIKGISGTEIKEIMESISLAAVYQHLYNLETKGLISRKKDGKNVLYFITEGGKKILDALDILITLL